MRYILDTNVISEPARPAPCDSVLEHLEKHDGKLVLPCIAWHELVYGADRIEEGPGSRI